MSNPPLATGLSVIGLAFAVSACVPATYTYEQLDPRSQFVQTSLGGSNFFGGPNMSFFGQPPRTGFQQQSFGFNPNLVRR